MDSNTNHHHHHHHSLSLELGYPSSPNPNTPAVKPPPLSGGGGGGNGEPTLTLALTSAAEDRSGSTASSLSVKRERDSGGGGGSEDLEMERGCVSRASDEDEEGTTTTTAAAAAAAATTTTRKKLRLTKDQSVLLEESFKLHTTLNPKQKKALAERLNLRPRQVEVWFQNRRARTKLKQTEVDCEYLKKCCETLTDENKRLQKEVDELKSMRMATQRLPMQLPAATLTICPSCERIAAGKSPPPSNTPFANPHFFPSFTNPSAAC